VRDYLLNNPEIVDRALRLLQEKRQAEARLRAEAAIRGAPG